MSITDKITQLTTIRASMREKLVAKGVDASTHNFADFPNDVESISTGGLPSEYEAVEYIESDGNQYIDTGFIPNNRTAIKAHYILPQNPTSGITFGLFGTDVYNVSSQWFAMTTDSSYTYLRQNWITGSEMKYNNEPNAKLAISFGGGSNAIGFVNGTECYQLGANNSDGYNNSNNLSLFLFAVNSKTQGGQLEVAHFGKYRLFMFQIHNSLSGEMYRNFVPCVRKSDDEAGLYDLVNGVFYTNQGTGDFIIPTGA